MRTYKEVDMLLDERIAEGKEINAFIRVYISSDKSEEFKRAFINAYNKNVALFRQVYLSLAEKEGADWEFEGWPEEIRNNKILDKENGLLIMLENYCLEVFGENIPLPIEYSEITSTIKNIEGFEYEYEGIINEYNDPIMGGYCSYLIGNDGRTDYTYTWKKLSEQYDVKRYRY